MKSLAALLSVFLLVSTLSAEVVRPTPDFNWVDATGGTKNLKALRGRPVVILIAESPRQWAFRSQVGQLQKIYERFAAQGLVCIAAFSREPSVIRSNIPFLNAADGPSTAAAFDTTKGFAIAIVGQDGNMDCFSSRVIAAQRIYDILDNSFVKQKQLRRD
jgi:hypothetical protein